MRVKRPNETASVLLGLLPLGALLELYALFAHAAIMLGRPPGFSERPNTAAFWLHAFTVELGLYAVAPVVVLAAPFAFWWLHRGGTRVRTGLILFFVTGLMTYAVLCVDPGRALNWFLD